MTFESEGFLIVAIYIWLPPASYVVFSDNSGLYFYLKICGITRKLCVIYIYVNTSYYENVKSFGHCSPYIQLFEENRVTHIEAQNTEL